MYTLVYLELIWFGKKKKNFSKEGLIFHLPKKMLRTI